MMNTYQRTGKPIAPKTAAQDPTPNASDENGDSIRVDGFAQVLDLLKVADPAFRESLLRRMARQNPDLVLNLRRQLTAGGY